MPIFDLFCKKCNEKVELIAKQGDKVKCRKCGNVMTRLPSQANFSLKGDCWSTDSYGLKERNNMK